MLESAKNPVVVVDGGGGRGTWEEYVPALIDALKVPVVTTILGKGIVDETHPLYGGPYVGYGTPEATLKLVEQSECILWLGNLPSDFNT